jgi:phosphohistidine phosphatase
MKTLILIRHAKSSWDEAGLSDRERPLNKRGMRDAPEMGRRLAKRGLKPGLIVTSPARRAVMTAQPIAEAVGYPIERIVEEEDLYGGGRQGWIETIRRLDNRLGQAALIGHNPAVSDLLNFLTRSVLDALPTCAAVIMVYDAETWRDVVDRLPVTTEIDFPKKER